MQASEKDIKVLAPLIVQLWPDHTLEEAEDILKEYIEGAQNAVIVHCIDDRYVGLALCGLRNDYVEGCHSSPVGFLEGIVVDSNDRMKGIATILCKECEEWARKHGCTEFASDCELANEESLRFHLSIGFEEENRIICFKKKI